MTPRTCRAQPALGGRRARGVRLGLACGPSVSFRVRGEARPGQASQAAALQAYRPRRLGYCLFILRCTGRPGRGGALARQAGDGEPDTASAERDATAVGMAAVHG